MKKSLNLIMLLGHYHYLLLALVSNVIEGVCRNLISIYMGSMIDVVIYKNLNSILADFAIIVMLSIGLFISISCKDTLLSYYLESGMNSLRKRIINLFGLSRIEWFDKWNTGELLGRLNSDIQEVNDSLRPVFISGFSAFISFIITFLFIVRLNCLLCIVLIMSSFISSLLNWALSKKLNYLINKKMNLNIKMSSFITDCCNGIETVKYLSLEKNLMSLFNNIIGIRQKAEAHENVIKSSIQSVFALLRYFPQVLVCLVGVGILSSKMSIGALIAIFLLSANISSFINSLPSIISSLRSFQVACDRIIDITCVPQENEEHYTNNNNLLFNDRWIIEFKDLSFSYDDSNDILQDVSMKIEKGSFNMIVGESGTGKSSIIKLLCGFYLPDSGKIFIDGIDTSKIDKRQLREHISYVPQSPYLMEASIEDNITSFNKADYEKIKNVIEEANLSELLYGDNRLSEFSFENENNFSGGQKQRITLARALYKEAELLLFDEATSSLDSASEEKIIKALYSKTKQEGKTILFITHNQRYLNMADQILFLKNKKIKSYSALTDFFRENKNFCERRHI